MVMEAIRDDPRFELTIVGHNGSESSIPFVDLNRRTNKRSSLLDESTQLKVLQSMVAHTQYTYPGDRKLEAIDSALTCAKSNELILFISDANLKRYRIEADEVSQLLQKRHDVHTHLIFIGSMGNEANDLVQAIPNERAQVCFDSAHLPVIIKSLVSSVAKTT